MLDAFYKERHRDAEKEATVKEKRAREEEEEKRSKEMDEKQRESLKNKETKTKGERERCLGVRQAPVCSLRPGLSNYLSLSFKALQSLGEVL